MVEQGHQPRAGEQPQTAEEDALALFEQFDSRARSSSDGRKVDAEAAEL